MSLHIITYQQCSSICGSPPPPPPSIPTPPINTSSIQEVKTNLNNLASTLLSLVSEYRVTQNDYYKNNIINIFNTSKKLLNSKNSFNFYYYCYGFHSDEYIRNWSVAWMLEALSVSYNFINELQTNENKDFIKSVADYLVSEIQQNGLVRGGYGVYVNNSFDNTYVYNSYLLDDSIYTYFSLKSVYAVTQNPTYLSKANSLKSSILNNFWDGEKLVEILNSNSGNINTYTMGSIFLNKIGVNKNYLYSNIKYLEEYFRERDFKSHLSPIIYKKLNSNLGYPNTNTEIWFRGYFMAFYAKSFIYKQNIEFNEESKKLSYFLEENIFPYSIGKDTNYGIYEFASIATSCWYIFVYNLINHSIESFWFL
jgi:hypothetical protein